MLGASALGFELVSSLLLNQSLRNFPSFATIVVISENSVRQMYEDADLEALISGFGFVECSS